MLRVLDDLLPLVLPFTLIAGVAHGIPAVPSPVPPGDPEGSGGPPMYEARVLGTSGWGLAIPRDINNRGVAVGEWDSGTVFNEPRHAVIWSPSGMIDLTPMPSVISASARAINDEGVVAGHYRTDGTIYSAGFRWSQGTLEVLPTFAPGHQLGYGVSDSGVVVGRAMHPAFQVTATAWDAKLGEHDLGALGHGTGIAHDMNGWGAVVGASGAGGGRTHAFVWIDGDMIDLGTLGHYGVARLHAVNDRAEAVGFSGTPFDEHPIYWSRGTGIVDLPDLGNNQWAGANDIDDGGTIVGYSWGSNGRAAVLWHDMVIHELEDRLVNGAGWRLFEATAINELGQIVGHGTYNGQSVAYVLTPVDTPMTTVIGPTPGHAGAVNRIEVVEAVPGATVRIHYGLSPGSTPVVGCAGASVEIAGARSVDVVADADGHASVDLDLPLSIRGRRLMVQAVDLSNCDVTNRVVRKLD